MTDFAWDRVLLVAPGTPREAISRRLGSEWTGDLGYDAGDLLIFLRDGEVVRFADYRGRGRFDGLDAAVRRVHAATAVFVVEIRSATARSPAHGGGH